MLWLCIQEGNVTLFAYPEFKEHVLPDYAAFILRFCLFALAHSLFATSLLKRAAGGSSAKGRRAYRLAYNLASIAMFGWVMGACRNSPVLYFAPGIWSLVMYLLQLVVACILFCCLRQTGIADFLGLGRASTEAKSEARLTTTGCYGMVRHPLYLFATTFLILNPVMTAQWLLLTVCSAIYFIIGALIEEQRLVGQFGDKYRRYQQDVPFIVPSMGRFRQPPPA